MIRKAEHLSRHILLLIGKIKAFRLAVKIKDGTGHDAVRDVLLSGSSLLGCIPVEISKREG